MDYTPHGKPIFTWFNEQKAREIIHRSAIKFAWPAEVMFDGPHCLRHGGAAEADLGAQALLRQEISCMSRGTWKHYADPKLTREDEIDESEDE